MGWLVDFFRRLFGREHHTFDHRLLEPGHATRQEDVDELAEEFKKPLKDFKVIYSKIIDHLWKFNYFTDEKLYSRDRGSWNLQKDFVGVTKRNKGNWVNGWEDIAEELNKFKKEHLRLIIEFAKEKKRNTVKRSVIKKCDYLIDNLDPYFEDLIHEEIFNFIIPGGLNVEVGDYFKSSLSRDSFKIALRNRGQKLRRDIDRRFMIYVRAILEALEVVCE